MGQCQTTRPAALAHSARGATPGTVATLARRAGLGTIVSNTSARLTWFSLLLGVSYSAVRYRNNCFTFQLNNGFKSA